MVQRSYYRAIWISDIHLGTRACKAGALLDFLRHHIAETLYLVGDIVDGWNWGPSWHWSVEQQELVDEIVRWRRSVNVVFLPGNHDEAQVGLVEGLMGPVATKASLVHATAAGARMLVIHGHQFDGSLNPNRLLPMIGSQVYARCHNADGVICGHIHRSDHRKIGSVTYVNDGDWVLNRTALVEDHDGALRIIRWPGSRQNVSIYDSPTQVVSA